MCSCVKVKVICFLTRQSVIWASCPGNTLRKYLASLHTPTVSFLIYFKIFIDKRHTYRKAYTRSVYILVTFHRMNTREATTQIKSQVCMPRAPKLPRAPLSYDPHWVTLSLSSATCKVLPVFALHVNSIMQQVLIHAWLLVFNIMFVKIVHISRGTHICLFSFFDSRGWQILFWKGPDSKYFGLCRLFHLVTAHLCCDKAKAGTDAM